MWRSVSIALLFATSLVAQGTPPRTHASKYEVHGALGDFTIGAEYLVHSVPASSGYLIADEYLVVEVALFGPRLGTVKLSQSDFLLRVVDNAKKDPSKTLQAQSPSFIGSFLAPRRAPGDPNQPAPRSPVSSSVDREPPPPISQQVDQAALPIGEQKVPIAGALFFPYKGKTGSIKSLELIYAGSAGKLTLRFF